MMSFAVMPSFFMMASCLIFIASVSRFCVFWIMNTIRKVMIVVLVLMISCQVSENCRIGPLIHQTISTPRAIINTHGRPNHVDTVVVNLVKISFFCFFAIRTSFIP